MSFGLFKNVTQNRESERYINKQDLSLTYKGWYAMKPNQLIGRKVYDKYQIGFYIIKQKTN